MFCVDVLHGERQSILLAKACVEAPLGRLLVAVVGPLRFPDPVPARLSPKKWMD
jgi:hypothetical protein